MMGVAGGLAAGAIGGALIANALGTASLASPHNFYLFLCIKWKQC